MIAGKIDERELARQLEKMATAFGEENEAAICRWGVATCRDLVKRTQAWGDDTKAKENQQNAMMKDAARSIFFVDDAILERKIKQKKLTGLQIKGELVLFTPNRNLSTPQEVNDFIDLNRTTRKGRVPRMKPAIKGIASGKTLLVALRIRYRRAGKAKGGWIGAGISIGSKQKKGSRITIGKKFVSYAHKFKIGGTSRLRRSVWTPAGDIINNVAHVSTEHVLKKSDAKNAINEGARSSISQYENAMQKRLNRQSK